MQKNLALRFFIICATTLFLHGCSTPGAQIIRTTLDPAVDDVQLSNILVISVAGSYADRARVEQGLSVALTAANTTASPYFAIIGRNPQVTRNTINTAIQSRRFDGVLFVRAQGQDIPNLAPGRPTGRNFQLFLYDYQEFNRPVDLPTNSTVTLVSEIYTTAGEKKVWGVESLVFDKKDLTEVLELQVSSIAAQIKTDKLTAN